MATFESNKLMAEFLGEEVVRLPEELPTTPIQKLQDMADELNLRYLLTDGGQTITEVMAYARSHYYEEFKALLEDDRRDDKVDLERRFELLEAFVDTLE